MPELIRTPTLSPRPMPCALSSVGQLVGGLGELGVGQHAVARRRPPARRRPLDSGPEDVDQGARRRCQLPSPQWVHGPTFVDGDERTVTTPRGEKPPYMFRSRALSSVRSMLMDVREYIDRLHIDGHTIGEDHDDDPILIDPDGRAVDTWRENYPYDERMTREEYDEQKYLLQVELLKFQTLGRGHGHQARAAVRGPRRRRQGRHHQALHGAPQPALRPDRGARQAERPRAGPVVLPALRPAPADRRARWCSSTGPGTTAPASSG